MGQLTNRTFPGDKSQTSFLSSLIDWIAWKSKTINRTEYNISNNSGFSQLLYYWVICINQYWYGVCELRIVQVY
jgi:hypothetical protein